MALLNTASSRPTVIIIILNYLGQQRGKKVDENRLFHTLSPDGLFEGGNRTDVEESLGAAITLKLVQKNGSEVQLTQEALAAIQKGEGATVSLLRNAVLDPSVNTGPWGSQAGARDVTNALAWYLTLSADTCPTSMEGTERSAKDLQAADFGPRHADGGGWPIENDNRWSAFRYWACGLGFAWVSPDGVLIPDPTPAIRDALPKVMAGSSELSARDFISRLAGEIPVLDDGRYRKFVEDNWIRRKPEQQLLTSALSEALSRIREENRLLFDDRADAARVTRFDGETFSHVRLVPKR